MPVIPFPRPAAQLCFLIFLWAKNRNLKVHLRRAETLESWQKQKVPSNMVVSFPKLGINEPQTSGFRNNRKGTSNLIALTFVNRSISCWNFLICYVPECITHHALVQINNFLTSVLQPSSYRDPFYHVWMRTQQMPSIPKAENVSSINWFMRRRTQQDIVFGTSSTPLVPEITCCLADNL